MHKTVNYIAIKSAVAEESWPGTHSKCIRENIVHQAE